MIGNMYHLILVCVENLSIYRNDIKTIECFMFYLHTCCDMKELGRLTSFSQWRLFGRPL